MIATPPQKPVVIITTSMATKVSVNISVDYMPVGNYTFNITWQKLSPCSESESGYNIYTMNVTAASTEYVMQMVTGLDEGSTYNITVTVINAAGHVTSDPIITTTLEAGN